MIDEQLLYIKRGNRITEITKTNRYQVSVEQSIADLLNQECLKDLSTLDGRLTAIRSIYHINKNVPVYISPSVVLFQTSNKKAYDNVYVNAKNIRELFKDEDRTQIVFIDNTVLTVNKPYHLIKQYQEKCLKIRKPNRDYL